MPRGLLRELREMTEVVYPVEYRLLQAWNEGALKYFIAEHRGDIVFGRFHFPNPSRGVSLIRWVMTTITRTPWFITMQSWPHKSKMAITCADKGQNLYAELSKDAALWISNGYMLFGKPKEGSIPVEPLGRSYRCKIKDMCEFFVKFEEALKLCPLAMRGLYPQRRI